MATRHIPQISDAPTVPYHTPFTLSDQGMLTNTGWTRWFGKVQRAMVQAFAAPGQAFSIEDTHANRIDPSQTKYDARKLPLDTLFHETDRNVFYRVELVGASNAWLYFQGTMVDIYDHMPLDLGANDAGFLWTVSDYCHTLLWTGTAWQAKPGELWDGGKIEGFLVNPDPMEGWALCDGSVVQQLKKDGSRVNVKLPDPVSPGKASYLKFGATASAVVNPAIAPDLTMDLLGISIELDPYTPQGRISQQTLILDSYTPAGTVTASFVGTPQTFVVIGTTVGLNAAFQSPNPYTPAGTVHTTFAGTPAILTGTVSEGDFLGTQAALTGRLVNPQQQPGDPLFSGQISATGEQQNVVLRPFFRL